MREKGLECLVLFGWPSSYDFYTANARYVCSVGGNATTNILVFPLEGEPTVYVNSSTFTGYWKAAQDWVPDVRPKAGTWGDTLAGRIKELGLEKSNVGMDGLGGPLVPDGWVPHSVVLRMEDVLPQVNLVNIHDMLEKLRTIKSAEEIAILDKAAVLGDLMLARAGIRPVQA